MREINGLNDEEVVKNRRKYGSNKIDSKNQDTFFKLFIESLGDPIIKILLIALAVKTLFLFRDFDYFETIGIVLAILVASFISSISEYGSNKAFLRLQEDSSRMKCKVKRNGKIVEVYTNDIVYDDIVYLTSGDKVCADGILIYGNLTVDESMINGEAKESYKESVKNNKIEYNNKLYRGSVIYENEGYMRVCAVGNNTMYGKMAKDLTESASPSPLKEKLGVLAKTISKIGYFASVLVTISYLFNEIVIKNNFNIKLIVDTVTNYKLMFAYILNALTLAVTIIVVAVPEGLPMMITLVLSTNMKKMLKDNVLVRKLVGIETAGSLNVLFTDKTGTITKGNMEVLEVKLGNMHSFNSIVEINKYMKYSEIFNDSVIYNNQGIYDRELNSVVGGNITDRALLNFCKNVRSDNVSIIDKIPFSSKNKYSVTIIKKNNRILKLIKGAYEKIIENCNYYVDQTGSRKILTGSDKRLLDKYVNDVSNNGIRVLALSMSYDKVAVDNLRDSTLVGIVILKDEVRDNAKSGIELISNAGVQTIMITGDNKNTSLAIAKEVGIVKSDNDIVLTSDELNKLSDEEVKKIIPRLRVISRALPTDKKRMVEITKSMNLVVGMTGDGVNDSVALKKADVGFAMGSGTSVSKEASDIVILDDNINSIASAILYGRTIFKNIRKFIIFQLTVNFCAVFISIVGPFIGVGYPVTVIQMLWINMVMDTLAGLAFSYEVPRYEYMKEKPKCKNEHIINKYMFNEIIVMGLYSSVLYVLFLKLDIFSNLYRKSSDNIYLLTAFFSLFIFTTILNSFNARTYRINLLSNLSKNKVFMVIILCTFLIQLYLVYYGGNMFRTSGLTLKELIVTIFISLSVIPVDIVRKLVFKRFGESVGV